MTAKTKNKVVVKVANAENMLELRSNNVEFTAEDEGLKVKGYVNETGKFSSPLGTRDKFIEVIEKGAFQRSLDNADRPVEFLVEHDHSKLLSSTKNGSLVLREDDKGLYMEADIVDTSWGKDVHKLIDSGLYTNMSFGFRAKKDDWKKGGDILERHVQELDLFEVSVLRNPAYPDSSISARSDILDKDDIVPLEFRSENVKEISGEIRALSESFTEKLDSLDEQIKELDAKIEKTNAEKEQAKEEEKEKETVEKEEAETVEDEVEKETEKETEEVEKETKTEAKETETETEKDTKEDDEKESKEESKTETETEKEPSEPVDNSTEEGRSALNEWLEKTKELREGEDNE